MRMRAVFAVGIAATGLVLLSACAEDSLSEPMREARFCRALDSETERDTCFGRLEARGYPYIRDQAGGKITEGRRPDDNAPISSGFSADSGGSGGGGGGGGAGGGGGGGAGGGGGGGIGDAVGDAVSGAAGALGL